MEIRRIALIALPLCLAANSAPLLAQECPTPAALDTLTGNETQYMVNRGLPAFRHALEDGKIRIAMSKTATPDASDSCAVQLEVTLPQADVDAANRMLDGNPAKRIMLTQQGYVLPESGQLHATFRTDPATLKVAHQDTLAVSELGKLRASVEMIYAMLTQQGATIANGSANDKPWSTALRNRQVLACSKQTMATDLQEAACSCRNDKLMQRVAERQMENIEYLHTDPYAFATGALGSFRQLDDEVLAACGLRRK